MPPLNGTVADTGGSGLAIVALQLTDPDGNYWNGSAWTASAGWFAASGFTGGAGTASWSCASCSAAISGRTPNLYGAYLLTVQATDGAGNSNSAQAAFAWQNSVYTFTYDALDRLTSAYGSTYSYDSLGRPTGGTDPWGDALTFAQAAGHVHAVGGVSRQLGGYSSTDSYSYDADGNLTAASVASTGQAQTLTWDAENRLISVTVAGGATEQYVYDQDDQWAEKIVGSGSSAGYTFYVGPDYEVQVSDGKTGMTQYYEFGGQRVAGDFPGFMGTQSLEYLHVDHLGSTLAATGSSGGLASGQTRYDAYGNDLYGTVGELPTDYDYTGEKLDGTGFYQMGARWYDPYIAQWIEPDSIVPDLTDPQSLNRYMYARGNPLRYNDPSGHDPGCPVVDGASHCGAGTDGTKDPDWLPNWTMATSLADLQNEPEPVLLARVIYGEARGEPTEGQKELAGSVLVRAAENFVKYGNSVTAQVLRYGQYSEFNPLTKDPGNTPSLSGNTASAMDPTQDPTDPTGIQDFHTIYDTLAKPMYEAMHHGSDVLQPEDETGPNAIDSVLAIAAQLPSGAVATAYGKQNFFQYPDSARTWPWSAVQ